MPAALRTPLGESRNAEKALLLKQKAALGTLAGGGRLEFAHLRTTASAKVAPNGTQGRNPLQC